MTEIFAHRGLHVDERENTVAAFLAARALGVDGVELDVRRSLDGGLVVHHDARAEGLVIGASPSRRLPEFVPTLLEALGACAGIRVNVEIKNLRDGADESYDGSGDFARQVVTSLHDAAWSDRAGISSFDLETCRVVRSFDPDLYVGWLTDWSADVMAALSVAAESGLDAINPFFLGVDSLVVGRAAALGVALNVWTVNASHDIAAMLEFGVASIITDDPATALRLARD